VNNERDETVDKMDVVACSTQRRDEKWIQNFSRNSWKKKTSTIGIQAWL